MRIFKVFCYIKATYRKMRVMNKIYNLAMVASNNRNFAEAANLLKRYERISKNV